MIGISYFFIFCVFPIIILNIISLKSQRKFIKLYREKKGEQPFYPGELQHRYGHKPHDFLHDLSGIMTIRLKLIFGKFNDKDLDKAANEVRLYFIAMILVLIINIVIIFNSI